MTKENLNSILEVSREVQIGEKKIIISKLALGEYSKILLTLKNMPGSILKDLQNLDTENEDALIGTLFGVIGEAWGQVLDIIAIGSGIEKEVIESDPNIGLDGGIELFVAIWEINKLANVMKTVKNLMSHGK